jgi:hypothetical protein
MKAQRLIIALTFVNVAVLIATMTWRPAHAQGESSILRGGGLEIVDQQGKVRASLSVMPAGTSTAGERYPETVLLRLITERGRPSVKLSASEEGAGASFVGPTGTRNTYVILGAEGNRSTLRVRNEDGREQVMRP